MPLNLTKVAGVAALVLVGSAAAQPLATSASNAASSIDAALPNGGLAQGGMFVVYGQRLGPGSLVIVDAFPLPTTLGGTSVRVAVGQTAVDALMVYTIAGQVAAILPSSTPTGAGTLTVSFGGQASPPLAVRVERSRFGIFTLNQAGSGPGIFTDPANAVNTLVQPAQPGAVWVIWGTGIGPVTGDESGGPLPGDLAELDVVVLVGGQPAEILYRGRSGCCAGLDQIAFRVPPGADFTGCFVPVVVLVGGVPSNTVAMSVGEERVCADGEGWRSADIQAARERGHLRAAAVTLRRVDLWLTTPGPISAAPIRTETVTAAVGRFDFLTGMLRAQRLTGISVVGACTVFRFTGLQPEEADPTGGDPLDAGAALRIASGARAQNVARVAPGVYAGVIGGGQTVPGLPGLTLPFFLTPGVYRVESGAGAATGPFSAEVTVTNPPDWTNRNSIATISRSAGVTVQWSGADAGREFVEITGSSVALSAARGAGFVCRQRASAGTFTVPASVLSALPPSQTQEQIPSGLLSVGTVSRTVRFTAPGLDIGLVNYSAANTRMVSYR
jgi:uncharacterized protein (TIGR03437 family)